MMRLATLIFLTGFSIQAFAGPKDVVRDYPSVQIAPDIHVIHGPLGEPSVENQGFMNNPGWIVTRDGVVLIDPGSSVQAGRMVLKQIAKTTNKPVTHVFVTHVHGDHWLGNHALRDAFPKAQLIAHPDMIAKAAAGEAQMWLSLMDNRTEGYTAGTQAVIPSIAAADGQEYMIGGKTLRMHLSNDAHSKTDMMIELVEDRVIFAGDNVLSQRVARMDDGSFKGNIRAIEQAEKLAPKIVVPGHGISGGPELLGLQKEYFSTLYAAVKAQYDAGKSDFEMKPEVVAKLGKFKDWHGFDVAVGKHISLAVLEVEAE
jgi:glyoxylase-like metal-dependent hydrolase (beta-lactamase superfamily II)